jgi:hypothetical protein
MDLKSEKLCSSHIQRIHVDNTGNVYNIVLEISNEKAMQGERSFRTKVKKNNKLSRIRIWKN